MKIHRSRMCALPAWHRFPGSDTPGLAHAWSMKAVVNDALRVGLGMRGKSPRPRRFEVQPHAFAFKPGIDVDRLNQLVDELEVDERVRQLLW